MDLKTALFTAALIAFVTCPSDKQKPTSTLTTQGGELFFKPFMYGTAILLFAVMFGSVYFVYRMSDERDPLIYSKFLTVKKKNT